MLIDATHAEETRVVVVDGNRVEDFDFESLNKRQLAGNIYLAKVTRVEPSLQAAFVDYGGNRHGFLAFSEIHPDYYQIPKADREALLREEAEYAREADEETTREKAKPRGRSRSRKRPAPADAQVEDAVIASDEVTTEVSFAGVLRRAAAVGRRRRHRHPGARRAERPADEPAAPPVMDAMAEAAAIDPTAADPHLETDTAAPADALVDEDEEDLGEEGHDHDHEDHDHGDHDHGRHPRGLRVRRRRRRRRRSAAASAGAPRCAATRSRK